MAQLQGKVIAITGAGSGIGRATAREAAARGALLALSDIDGEAVGKVVDELQASGVNVTGTQVDVSNSESVDAWIEGAKKYFGRLDGAANVAGVEKAPGTGVKTFSKIGDTTDDHWDFIHRINLTGVFYCLRAELRAMTLGGSIVNVASIAGIRGHPGMSAYTSSKHGVIGLTRAAAKEYGEMRIRVNAIAPIQIDRQDTDDKNVQRYTALPLRRKGTPEDMARTICFILSEDSSYTTGQVFLADGGMNC